MMLGIGKLNLAKSKGFAPLEISKTLVGKVKSLTGFTFIELMLVAVIILVVTGLTAPLFRKSFSGLQLKNNSQKLVQLMRYVQAKAIAERRLTRVNFDFAEGLFWPTAQDETSGIQFRKIKGRWGKVVKVDKGITVESGIEDEVSFIVFYPDGGSAQAEIRLRDKKGRVFVISAGRTISYEQVEE